jgi:hypothetical protein
MFLHGSGFEAFGFRTLAFGPQNPSFSSVSVASASQVSLAWAIPLDQDVGIAPGATEAEDETTNASGNYYRVGDVGVQVYRNGTVISGWTAGGEQTTSLDDAGLSPNTSCTYTLETRDNNSEGRGAWHNATGPQGATRVWTLSVPPATGSIMPDQTSPPAGSNVTWTAINRFGAGQVGYYRYAWDMSPTHTWTDAEPQRSGGTLATMPASAGAWYLHVRGYNGANVGNGTFDYLVTATPPPVSATALASSQNPSTETSNVTFTATVSAVPPAAGTPTGDLVFLANGTPFSTNALVSGTASASTASLPVGTNNVAVEYAGDGNFLGSLGSVAQVVQVMVTPSLTNAVLGIVDNSDGTFMLNFVGTPQAQYYVVSYSDLAATTNSWVPLAGSTNTVTNTTGLWSYTVMNTTVQQFYRSAAVVPGP